MADERYCVIGAGAAGLGTMEVLQRNGIAFDCFEQSDRVGGHWHTDYESLHLITSRDLSGFTGYPMPSDYPVYPSRDQMRGYLERFASETGVRAHVRFGVRRRADRARRRRLAATAGWSRPPTARPALYTGVLVCNGHLRDQNLPSYPGEFTGRQIHSGSYRSIDDIEGTRVLTVGAGNSGCDLAVDVANARLESTISIRRGQMFQPKAVFGRPRAEIGWLAKLPVRLNERIARLMSDMVIGPTRAYRGLPEPRDAQPQRAAAGRQQPAAVLDPSRPDRRRRRDRAARRAAPCTSSTGRAASSTRSCGRPDSRCRCRSSTGA